MARTPGLLNISSNFEPDTAEPFDARLRVPLLSDLTNSATFGSYFYLGMIVSVYNDSGNNGAYRLNALPLTTLSNWEKLGATTADKIKYSIIFG